MCIRDRSWEGNQPTFPSNVADTLSSAGNVVIDSTKWRPLGDVGLSAAVRLSLEVAVPVGRPAERRQPVSYTHLRAHETPEHLVCRLLLEKKKKTYKKNRIKQGKCKKKKEKYNKKKSE
eukprot:TRINITY_DN53488_c0_g1_i1.p1 TRINITY_DN53488_c0_g1~~TRINITY_DN53488_c0_g1_i1.p1  ORF type:complete len:119 (+),score=22.61 TRINITY_DN53488_c0_g1_i1:187-543(+)